MFFHALILRQKYKKCYYFCILLHIMKKLLLFIGLGILLQACAREMIPSGGPMDNKPPEIIRELPGNRTLSFQDQTIRIFFDEYINLNNPNTNIIFSPPLSTLPTYTISGRSLVIRFNEALMPDKTYNVAFTNAVKDYNEGNILPFYQYTFSTGTSIDSFMIDGFLYNAETLEPEKDIYVFLYGEDIDSLPYSTSPTYITRSQQNGYFSFRHISRGDYKVFALNDINNNLRYDLPNESIAFSDTMVKAHVIQGKDTSAVQTDTVGRNRENGDTLVRHNPVKLWLFTPVDTVQRLEKPAMIRPGAYRISFKLPFSEISTKFLRPDTIPSHMETVNNTRDTVTWYFKSRITDTVTLELTVDNHGPDTVHFLPGRFQPQRGGRGARRTEETEKLSIRTLNGGELHKPFTLTFSYPVLPVDSFAMVIIQNRRSGNDTVTRYYSVPDTFVTSLPLIFPLEERVPYILKIKDSVFYGYDGATHDSLTFRFTSKSEKDYGNLTIDIEVDERMPYIVQLLSPDNKVIRTNFISSNSTLSYMHLPPGNYRIKIIEDRNGNGKWDTGNYRKKIQPEKVIFPQKTFTVRGYWDMEETLNIHEQKNIRTGSRR